MQIAFTTILPQEGFKRLQGHSLLPVGADPREAEVLVATFDYRVDKALIDRMPRLRLIANFGAGYNNIDLDSCRQRGIYVTNTPQPVVEPTAELAFALMISIARRTAELDRKLREGRTEPMGVMNNLSHTLYGKTLGIVGMGRIGSAMARRAEAFGMQVIYHNRHPRTDYPSARYVTMDELLETADYVSLNLPYTKEVHHLIGERELEKMRKTAYLINTARGAHVDEQALVEALRKGTIAGAALDVYEHEPQITPELLEMDNVVLSPHVGTGTMEDRLRMCENICDNILAFEQGRWQDMNIVTGPNKTEI
ncbi:MAG: NAD(P)-binding domain-containing protein [Paludibacteraceae bacterium]|nr:NAD(P)-binding domain-containing protein [Paludibacteraceae bacterium]